MADKEETKLTDQSVSAIDAAIAAANARKNTKKAAGTSTGTPTASAEKPAKKPAMTDEEKAAKQAAREKERAEKKVVRDAARAAKIAERDANRKPAHMRKVEKAAEKLPNLGQAAMLLFNEATANLAAGELMGLAQHIQHFNRVKATERALGQKLTVGQTVKIISGDPRFIGKTGTLEKVQRIRCYVAVEGFNKPAYLFTSDVQLETAKSEKQAKTA